MSICYKKATLIVMLTLHKLEFLKGFFLSDNVTFGEYSTLVCFQNQSQLVFRELFARKFSFCLNYVPFALIEIMQLKTRLYIQNSFFLIDQK